MKKPEEVMEILEAFDLTGSLRGAAELVGCDHKTVAHWVAARDAAGGGVPVGVRRRPMVDAFAEKIDELVDRSQGRVRADVAHAKLVAMGYLGSERTTRRAVADAKRRWRAGHARRTRPWVPEPGLWMQWDYGDGPRVGDRETVLFCAWLAWSRFRVVLALWDKTMASVIMALDRALRRFGGAPTYALTDNERTVSVDHVCGIAVRNPQIVAVARHYGLTIATCVPADPQSKGGSEATVRIAKADLVPTDHNLRDAYADMGELELACEEFTDRVNTREHRVTRRPPAVMLAEERERLHPLPGVPHTVCFGETRKVGWQSTISVGGAVYGLRCVETANPWGATWPPVGREHGRRRGEPMAVDGENPMAIDTAPRRPDAQTPPRSRQRTARSQRHRARSEFSIGEPTDQGRSARRRSRATEKPMPLAERPPRTPSRTRSQ